MSGIFISYRREDTRGDAGRLADDLKRRLGNNQIFRDIDAIEPGMDFVKAINKAVSYCDVLLAMIGPQWLTVTDKKGRRRVDDANDYVRLEIAAALSRDIRVIPVLVGGASMPAGEELPDGLAGLARRQAYDLSDKRWDYDVEQLLAVLEKIPGIKGRSTPIREKAQFIGNSQGESSFETLANITKLFGGSSETPGKPAHQEGQGVSKSGMSLGKKTAWAIALFVFAVIILGECSGPTVVPYYTPYFPY